MDDQNTECRRWPDVRPTAPIDNSHLPPAERAAANGYKDPEPPTRDERIMTVVADLEHAIRHNAPVTLAMLAEIKDLLGVQGDGVAAQGEQSGPCDPNVKPPTPNA
jgi:hypothetical protein